MGTSGSYGGSGQPGWDAARQAFDALVNAGDDGETDGDPADDASAAAAAALLDALGREDPEIVRVTPRVYPLGDLLPTRTGAGAGRGGGGGGGAPSGTGSSRGGGRAGEGSRRRVGRSAQRGAAAIAGAYALRDRDTATLAELGLDLADLETKSPVRQCLTILDVVIGDGNHPDDHALRQAASAQLKEILAAADPPTAIDSIRNFIANFVIELGVVELQARHRAGMTAEAIRETERRMRRYVLARVRGIADPGPRLAVSDFQASAMRILKDAQRVVFAEAAR
jgi:hypothetical protein